MLVITISIHASREGSDRQDCYTRRRNHYFNPRFPRGKRPFSQSIGDLSLVFQSTLPAGEATLQAGRYPPFEDAISIHASRGGSDKGLIDLAYRSGISIHASREGSDAL